MASIDGLMKCLVEEIALAGSEGIHPADVLRHVDRYYNERSHDCIQTGGVTVERQAKQKVDRRFQEKVWTWLTGHFGISVGKQKLGNFMSLAEVEAYNANRLAETRGDPPPDLEVLSSQSREPLKVHASEEHIWLATAGHAQDFEKVPRLDFVCLTVIAAHRERGILQPDLVRLTGQDKRSVPTRTQRLSDRGYIQKLPILTDSKRTSFLVLSKFAKPVQNLESSGAINPSENQAKDLPADSVKPFGHSKFLAHETLIRRALDILKDENMLIWDDLKKQLAIFRDGRLSRLMAEAVRRFEDFKILQRVRARSKPVDSDSLRRCVKLIREPTSVDWEVFFGQEQSYEIDADTRNDWEKFNDTALSNRAGTDILLQDEAQIAHLNPLPQSGLSTSFLSWNPDRLLVHMVHGVLKLGGSNGLSLQGIRRCTVGAFFGRPLEQAISRLVNFWQVSQPIHVRHLAIIRDAAQIGKTGFYVHYTYQAFESKVKRGEVAWDAVETLPELTSNVSLDDNGFTNLHDSRFQGHKNNATLTQCVEVVRNQGVRVSAKAPSVDSSIADDIIRGIAPSRKCQEKPAADVGLEQPAVRKGSKRKAAEFSQGQELNKLPKARGRPRKHPKIGAPANGLPLTEKELHSIETSQTKGWDHQCLKATPEIEAGVEAGVSEVQAMREVLPEYAIPSEEYFSQKTRRDLRKVYFKRPPLLHALYNLPSSAAHTVLLRAQSNNQSLAKSSFHGSMIGHQNGQGCSEYLPSCLAHGIPMKFEEHISETTCALKNPTQHPALAYLPSIAAHDLRNATWLLKSELHELPAVREKRNSRAGVGGNRIRKTMHTKKAKSPHSPQESASQCTRNGSKSASLIHSQCLTYEEQSALISRPCAGFFLGPVTSLRLSGARGRPRKCRVAIFRLQNMVSLPWFSVDHSNIIEEHKHHSLSSSPVSASALMDTEFLSAGDVNNQPVYNNNPNIAWLGGNLSERHSNESLAVFGLLNPRHVESSKERSSKRKGSPVTNHESTLRTKKVCSLDQVQRNISDGGDTPNLLDDGHSPSGLPSFESPEPELRTMNSENRQTPQDAELAPSIVEIPGEMEEKKCEPAAISDEHGLRGNSEEVARSSAIDNSAGNRLFEQVLQRKLEKPKEQSGGSFNNRRLGPNRMTGNSLKMRPFGGSAARARKELLMRIVQTHHGVYPGGQELFHSVSRAISATGAQSVPDRKTILHLKKALIGEGKLQEILFTFKDKQGLIQEKTIIALANLDPQDVKFKDLQNLISRKHPHPCFPATTGGNDQTSEPAIDIGGLRDGRIYTNRLPIEDGTVKPLFPRKSSTNVRLGGRKTRGSPDALRREDIRNSREQDPPASPERPAGVVEHISLSQPEDVAQAWRGTASKRRKTLRELAPAQSVGHSSTLPFLDFEGQEMRYPSSGPLPSMSHVYAAPARGSALGKNTREAFNATVDNVAAWEQQSCSQYMFFGTGTWVHYQYPEDDENTINPLALPPATNSHVSHSINMVDPPRTPATAASIVHSRTRKRKMPLLDKEGAGVKKRRLSNIQRKRSRRGIPGSSRNVPPQSALGNENGEEPKKSKTRGQRTSAFFNTDDDRSLLTAIVITRVLLGGVDLNLNWSVIAEMLGGKYDVQVVKRRWSTQRPRYKFSLDRWYSSFRKAFIRAYEDGDVPSLDFDNPMTYDWKWLLAWGLRRLRSPSQDQIELPSRREVLESQHNIRECLTLSHVDYYEGKHISTIPQRHAFAHRNPRFLPHNTPKASMPTREPLDLAKNWVQANVMTPSKGYKPEVAREKLALFGREIIDSAVSELLSERKIVQENKGRAAPARTYGISDQFILSFNFNLRADQLYQAAAYKVSLDNEVQASGSFQFGEAPSDGQMIALINLISCGMIRLTQEALPSNEFGLTTGDYRTRGINKVLLNFKILFSPTESYCGGLPLAPLPQIPQDSAGCVEQQVLGKFLPVWIDINGGCVQLLWRSALCAVLSLLSAVSCCRVSELERLLGSCLQVFEIRLILAWLVQAGAATWTFDQQDVVQLQSWWWTSLPEDLVLEV